MKILNYAVLIMFGVFKKLHCSHIGKHIPLYGDLLGRERVTGAKKTRAGCDYTSERFECIVEACAQWHAKQSFLGVILIFLKNMYFLKSSID